MNNDRILLKTEMKTVDTLAHLKIAPSLHFVTTPTYMCALHSKYSSKIGNDTAVKSHYMTKEGHVELLSLLFSSINIKCNRLNQDCYSPLTEAAGYVD